MEEWACDMERHKECSQNFCGKNLLKTPIWNVKEICVTLRWIRLYYVDKRQKEWTLNLQI
jgi:hypothetical protein